MTVYEWANLRKAAKTGRFGKVWKQFYEYAEPGSYRLTNSFRESRFEVEGDRGGLQHLAIYFLLASIQRAHWHLYSRTQPGGEVGPFDSGREISIGHSAEQPLDRRPTTDVELPAFRYDAKPVLASGEPPMLPNSESWTSGEEDSFSINGNTPALLSFLEHCLDLAEGATPSGTELRYVPGKQLVKGNFLLFERNGELQEEESVPLVVRRIR